MYHTNKGPFGSDPCRFSPKPRLSTVPYSNALGGLDRASHMPIRNHPPSPKVFNRYRRLGAWKEERFFGLLGIIFPSLPPGYRLGLGMGKGLVIGGYYKGGKACKH